MSDVDLRIRKAKAVDADELLQLKREVSTILLTRLGHSLEQIAAWQSKFATPEYIREWTRAPHAVFILEEVDPVGGVSELKAMAGLHIRNDGDDSYCYFGNSYCAISGQGYGSRLMEYRLGVVESFNVDYIECRVHIENERAQRFVEHYGFEEFGARRSDVLASTLVVYRKVVD